MTTTTKNILLLLLTVLIFIDLFNEFTLIDTILIIIYLYKNDLVLTFKKRNLNK